MQAILRDETELALGTKEVKSWFGLLQLFSFSNKVLGLHLPVSPVYWQQTTVYMIQERVEIILIHLAHMSLWEAAEEYHRWHPDQSAPHHTTIGRLQERFKATGNINDKQSRSVTNSLIHRVYWRYTKFCRTQNSDEMCFFAKESIKILNDFPTNLLTLWIPSPSYTRGWMSIWSNLARA